jgi:uncharacterized tellurite resistance protein B-like protein
VTLNEARCVLLASVMRADNVVHLSEIEFGMALSSRYAGSDRAAFGDDWQRSIGLRDRVDEAIARLRREWTEERETLINYLWEMATCDRELHPAEASLIMQYAKDLRVEAGSPASARG